MKNEKRFNAHYPYAWKNISGLITNFACKNAW